MNWQEVCDHPSLRNLPFKIELDETGKITMTPVKVSHSAFQGEIEFLLRSLLQTGKALPECAIHTRKGTKVADVAWVSADTFAVIKDQVECSIAPEICIEVFSSSNAQQEMDEKSALYFEQGAKEFWLCDEEGNMHFYSAAGELEHSLLSPDFPRKVEL